VQHAWLARWLADLLVESRGESLRAFGADAVAPVPLHWRRRWRRRYNQAEALAGCLASRLGLVLIRPLVRVKPTRTLAGRGRVERAAELKDAFRVRGGRGLDGRRVILVDDVLTTGATCGAAARALKRAGAARVMAVVVGRAEGRS
jgi:ComF family protein